MTTVLTLDWNYDLKHFTSLYANDTTANKSLFKNFYKA